MSIVLNEQNVPSRKTYTGRGVYSATTGKSLKIETSPGGEDILDVEVPTGKVWEISISLSITESDA